MTPEHKVDIAGEAAKAAPAVAVATATTVFGLTINEWVGTRPHRQSSMRASRSRPAPFPRQ
jgi:hypothetical protein